LRDVWQAAQSPSVARYWPRCTSAEAHAVVAAINRAKQASRRLGVFMIQPPSTPQWSGGLTLPAGSGWVLSGTGRWASHAATALMSASLRRFAIVAMQSGATVLRVSVRQAPICALM